MSTLVETPDAPVLYCDDHIPFWGQLIFDQVFPSLQVIRSSNFQNKWYQTLYLLSVQFLTCYCFLKSFYLGIHKAHLVYIVMNIWTMTEYIKFVYQFPLPYIFRLFYDVATNTFVHCVPLYESFLGYMLESGLWYPEYCPNVAQVCKPYQIWSTGFIRRLWTKTGLCIIKWLCEYLYNILNVACWSSRSKTFTLSTFHLRTPAQ